MGSDAPSWWTVSGPSLVAGHPAGPADRWVCGNCTHLVSHVKDWEETHRRVTGVTFLPLRDPGAKVDILRAVPCCFHHTPLSGEERRKES